MMDSGKKYAELFPARVVGQNASSTLSSSNLDTDIIVIGAGIAGASIAHYASSTNYLDARVIVVEQYDFNNNEYENRSNNKTTNNGVIVDNPGSSRGGPRRIGTVGGNERTVRAWQQWQILNNTSPDNNLLDITGEVYVFKLFPFGWMFMGIFGLYYTINKDKKPIGFQWLWTSHTIEDKLGPQQGFRKGCWYGCTGVYHQEAAALHTENVLQHFLTPSSNNLQVRYGTKATKIEILKEANDKFKSIRVSVMDGKSGNSTTLHCRHLVLAAGGWTGDLLKDFYQEQNQPTLAASIETKIQLFTCPIFKIKQQSQPNLPPRFSLAANCPIFSCVSQKVYGFPLNHQCLPNDQWFLPLRPFYHDMESINPEDDRVSEDQLKSIDKFTQEYFAKDAVEYSHCYTCRYPKLSLNGKNKFKPVLDFAPHTHQQIVVCAGLDGYGFKFGSIYGLEFIELLETGKAPQGMEWPSVSSTKKENWMKRRFRAVMVKLLELITANPNKKTLKDGSDEGKND